MYNYDLRLVSQSHSLYYDLKYKVWNIFWEWRWRELQPENIELEKREGEDRIKKCENESICCSRNRNFLVYGIFLLNPNLHWLFSLFFYFVFILELDNVTLTLRLAFNNIYLSVSVFLSIVEGWKEKQKQLRKKCKRYFWKNKVLLNESESFLLEWVMSCSHKNHIHIISYHIL